MLPVLAIAAAIAILHLVTNTRYGFHRDEFQFLSDANHLDWGFVAYPPFTPCVEWVGLHLFGLSLVGLRLFSVLAQSTAIVIAGLMARELGGQRLLRYRSLRAPNSSTRPSTTYGGSSPRISPSASSNPATAAGGWPLEPPSASALKPSTPSSFSLPASWRLSC
jgi:hypothetical protein